MGIPDLLVSFHSSEQPHHLMVRMMVMIVEVGDDDDDQGHDSEDHASQQPLPVALLSYTQERPEL